MLDGALQQRIVTALALAPLAVAGVLFLPTEYFALVLGSIMLLAAWEWASLAGIVTRTARLTYAVLIGISLLLFWHAPSGRWLTYVLVVLALWWCGLVPMLLRKQAISPREGLDGALLPTGLMVLAGPWLAIVHLHAAQGHGPSLVLFFFLLIWTTDTAAYFVGRQWGRAKLAPVLSPGKTWAGVYGALVGASGIILTKTMIYIE